MVSGSKSPEVWEPVDAAPAAAPAAPGLLGLDLAELPWIVLRRSGWLIAGFTLGCVLGVLYYMTTPTKYSSSAQLVVMRKDANLPSRGMEAASEPSSQAVQDLLATHIQILQSKRIVGNALKKHGYDQLPSIVGGLKKDQTPDEFVIERMTVTRGGLGQAKSGQAMNVEFKHSSPKETKEILDAVIASYQEFLNEQFQGVGGEAANLIAKAKVELGADLQTAEEEYRQFREKSPLLGKTSDSANVHRLRFEQLHTALSEVQINLAAAQARLDAVEAAVAAQQARGAAEIELLAVIDKQHLERLRLLVDVGKGDPNTTAFQASQPQRMEAARAENDSLLALVQQEQSLLLDLGPKHPRVEETRRQISAAKEFLGQHGSASGQAEKLEKLTPQMVVSAYRELLRQDLAALQSQQRQLQTLADAEQDAAKALVAFELKGESLTKEIERKQELYSAVLDRLRDVNLIKDYSGFFQELLSPPELGEKVSPKLSISLLVGAMLGLMLGGGAGFLRELTDGRFHNIEQLRTAAGMPVLAVIPEIQDEPALCVLHRPDAWEAEAFRGLRTALLRLTQQRGQKAIAVASCLLGDGKSLVVANLAVSIAASGRRVLLIDADLRQPQQHALFGLPSGPGLAEVLHGNLDFAKAVRGTAVERLAILASGEPTSTSAELLGSPRFAEMLAAAREGFDLVLVDGAALLAAADASIVAGQADGVVLVARLPQDKRGDVQRAQEMLRDAGARPMGLVVNHFRGGWFSSGGRYFYSRGAKGQHAKA